MTDARYQECEQALRERFNEYRNRVNSATADRVFEAVDSFVDCLRREGATPEAMVIAIKGVAKAAGAMPLDENARQEDQYVVDARIDDIVTRAIQRYFGNTTPAKGFGVRPA